MELAARARASVHWSKTMLNSVSKTTTSLMALIPHPVERIMKHWKSPVYAFYERVPRVSYVGGRRCHEFYCAARKCNYKSRRFLDNSNKASTGNLILHVKSCWGKEAWNAAKQCHNARDAREKVTKPLMGLGSTPGKRMRGNSGKGRVRVSHSRSMFTKAETRCVARHK